MKNKGYFKERNKNAELTKKSLIIIFPSRKNDQQKLINEYYKGNKKEK